MWRNCLSKAMHFSLTGQRRCSLDKSSKQLTHNLHLRILFLFCPILSSNLSFLHYLTLMNSLKGLGCSFIGEEIKSCIFQRAWYCIMQENIPQQFINFRRNLIIFPCLDSQSVTEIPEWSHQNKCLGCRLKIVMTIRWQQQNSGQVISPVIFKPQQIFPMSYNLL